MYNTACTTEWNTGTLLYNSRGQTQCTALKGSLGFKVTQFGEYGEVKNVLVAVS